MRNTGYVYTLIIMVFLLILISLVSYYVVISQPTVTDAVNKMQTDELYYFVEAVKTDYGRSVAISSQRSLAYLISYAVQNRVTFDNYEMRSCTAFHYETNGSQAAAVELMYCGTLYGNPDILKDVMENHTLIQWSQRMADKGDDINLIVDAKPVSIEIIPADSWKFYVVSKLDLTVYDKLNQSFYRGYSIPVVSEVAVDALEDPLYAIKTGRSDLVRYLTPCNSSQGVNASVVGSWLDTECYLSATNAPSFFDRLDGSLNASQKYADQTEKMRNLGFEPQPIGMESFADIDEFAYYNVSVAYNLSWVDHYYWNQIPGYCTIINFTTHPDFKVDDEHAMRYYIQELNCSITAGMTSFQPDTITVPVNTTLTWANVNPTDSCNLLLSVPNWYTEELIPGEQYSLVFNETGDYSMNCSLYPTALVYSGMIHVR